MYLSIVSNKAEQCQTNYLYNFVMMDFVSWLENIIVVKGWNRNTLSIKSGVDSGFVSRILNREREAGPETLIAFAKALELPPEFLFRKAGLLPPLTSDDGQEYEELKYLFAKLPARDRREIIEIIRAKIDLKQKVEKEIQERIDKLAKKDPQKLLEFIQEVLAEIGYTHV